MASRKNLNKNAISGFEEYGVQKRQTPKVEIVRSGGTQHKPLYHAEARLGSEVICNETGHTKHEARVRVSERALQMLHVQKHQENDMKQEIQLQNDIVDPVPGKDPVSALMEYGQFIKKDVIFNQISQDGPPHMPTFTFAAQLGNETFDETKSNSIRDAKKRAACIALKKLKLDGKLQLLYPDTGPIAVPTMSMSRQKMALGIPGKNPKSILNEYAQRECQKLRFESKTSGPTHKPVFTVTVSLGEQTFPPVEASSKKFGNVIAAENVLKILAEQGKYTLPKSLSSQSSTKLASMSSMQPRSHFDNVAMCSLQKIDELLLQTPDVLVGRKVVAAIVMLDESKELYRVVSIGSGNRCIKGSFITDDGTIIHDSHAEILARRGFKRFLYWLLCSKDLDILVKGESGKMTFKAGISFHLYISTAPCGDGALFTHNDQNDGINSCAGSEHRPVCHNTRTQGLLRAKQENGEGTIPVEPNFPGQTYDGIRLGGRLRIMSCSDKLCLWNVLGLQGALLSKFYEPVYLKSVTLGNLFHAGHLARALCCRIDCKIPAQMLQLPPYFHINHPDLGVVTYRDTVRAVEKSRSLSINWCWMDKEPEMTDGTIGMIVKTVSSTTAPSRLCKKSLLRLYHHQTLNEYETQLTVVKSENQLTMVKSENQLTLVNSENQLTSLKCENQSAVVESDDQLTSEKSDKHLTADENYKQSSSKQCDNQWTKMECEGQLTANECENMTYRELKLTAVHYTQAKRFAKQQLKDNGFGTWIAMPSEVDTFL